MARKDKSSDDVPNTHHLNVATGSDDPNAVLVNTIADLEDVDVTELSPLYSCINHLVEHVFDTPPPAEADASLTFSYEGFRITLYQNGLAVLRSPA